MSNETFTAGQPGWRHRHRRFLALLITTSIIASLVSATGLLSAAPASAAGQQIFDGPNGSVLSVAVAGDGTTYLGGSFTRWGPRTGSGAGISLADGSVQRTLPPVTGGVGVYAVVPDGLGGWFIGGDFTEVAGTARTGLAHILSTGDVDPNWNPQVDGKVRALAISGTNLVVGGDFSNLGGQSRAKIGAVATDTGAVSSWNPGADNSVYSLAPANGVIYVGGIFTNIGGQTRNRIAALNTTTGLATAFNPNASTADSSVNALLLTGSTLYVGGSFTDIGGQTRNRIAALDTTTGLATAFNPNASTAASSVNALQLSGTTLYAGGSFTNIGGQTRNRIAALDTTTGLATAFNPNASTAASSVNALQLSGTTLYVGGSFTNIGGQTRNRIAALDTTTATNNATVWNPNANSTVSALAVSGNSLYAGGEFNTLGGQTRNRIAAIDAQGNLTAWNPNTTGTNVTSLLVSGTTVYAGGTFTAIGGQSRNNIAALSTSTGNAIESWNPNANGAVKTFALADSMLYVGGEFTNIGGQPRNRIAALNTTSGLANSWDPNASTLESSVNALVLSGTTLYVGGTFTTIGGSTRNRIAALSTTTGLATAWNPNAGSTVNALALSGTTLYVGGSFQTIAGQTRVRLAALDTTVNTNNATSWNPGAGSTVNQIALSGTTLYVGGTFSSAGNTGGAPRNRIAALDTTTETNNATAWNPNASGSVSALTVAGNAVYVGGAFSTISGAANGSILNQYFVKLPVSQAPGAPTGVAAARADAGATVTWTAPPYVGSGITGYKIESAPGPAYTDWSERVADTGNTNTTANITGLSNGTNYRVRVTALSAAGTGGTSQPSQWFTPEAPSTLPSPPTNLAGTPGNGQITATWSASASVGAGATRINRYRTFALVNATPVQICQTSGINPATTCVLNNLSNGTAHTLTSRSFNNLNLYSDLTPQTDPIVPIS